VHGGSGGVGTAAIQLLKRADAKVFVTAGSEERCRRCRELGADGAFDYSSQDFAAATVEANDGAGVDVILDCVGGPYIERHLDILTTSGKLVVIGLQGGSQATLDLRRLMRARVAIIGSTLRARPADEKSSIIRAFVERFGADLESGAIWPVVDRVLPLEKGRRGTPPARRGRGVRQAGSRDWLTSAPKKLRCAKPTHPSTRAEAQQRTLTWSR